MQKSLCGFCSGRSGFQGFFCRIVHCVNKLSSKIFFKPISAAHLLVGLLKNSVFVFPKAQICKSMRKAFVSEHSRVGSVSSQKIYGHLIHNFKYRTGFVNLRANIRKLIRCAPWIFFVVWKADNGLNAGCACIKSARFAFFYFSRRINGSCISHCLPVFALRFIIYSNIRVNHVRSKSG